MSATTIIRKAKNRENPYTMISKALLQDNRLSLKARGLMGVILSMPDDWQIYKSDFEKRFQEGRDSIDSGFDELRYYGYLKLECVRDEKGQAVQWIYHIHEEPIEVDPAERAKLDAKRDRKRRKKAPVHQHTEIPFLDEQGNQEAGKPLLENPRLQITDQTKYKEQQHSELASIVEKSSTSPKKTAPPKEDKDAVVDTKWPELKAEIEQLTHTKLNKRQWNALCSNYDEDYLKAKAQLIASNPEKWDNPAGSFVTACKEDWQPADKPSQHKTERIGRYIPPVNYGPVMTPEECERRILEEQLKALEVAQNAVR